MTNQQWVQILIILLVLSMSAISAGLRKFREYQAKREAQAATLRRRDQVLRTGRADGPAVAPTMQTELPQAPTTVHDDARRRLIELAQRRKAELEEMARRAAGAAGGRGSGGGGGGAAPEPPRRTAAPYPPTPARTATPRPAQRAPQTAQRPPARPQARPAAGPVSASDARRNEDAENRRRREARERAEITREAAERKQTDRDRVKAQADSVRSNAEYTRDTGAPSIASSEITDEISPDQVREPRRAALAAAVLGLRSGAGSPQATAEAWRRAIIATEILNPPVAIREPAQTA